MTWTLFLENLNISKWFPSGRGWSTKKVFLVFSPKNSVVYSILSTVYLGVERDLFLGVLLIW